MLLLVMFDIYNPTALQDDYPFIFISCSSMENSILRVYNECDMRTSHRQVRNTWSDQRRLEKFILGIQNSKQSLTMPKIRVIHINKIENI